MQTGCDLPFFFFFFGDTQNTHAAKMYSHIIHRNERQRDAINIFFVCQFIACVSQCLCVSVCVSVRISACPEHAVISIVVAAVAVFIIWSGLRRDLIFYIIKQQQQTSAFCNKYIHRMADVTSATKWDTRTEKPTVTLRHRNTRGMKSKKKI